MIDKNLQNYIVEMRRYFHMHPETSFNELGTSKRIMEELKKMGLEPVLLEKNGIVVKIQGNKPGKTIALRADMDALSIQEETGCEYASVNGGTMHACGHDGHASMLLGVAKYFSQHRDFSGTVKCLFQSAEETGKGANAMIEQGALEGVDRVFAIHLWTGIECGEISVQPGPQTAAVGVFNIEIEGKGGHGSMPHECVDAVVVGCNTVNALQTVISREMNPMDIGVITVGEFHSGSRFNIIAGKANLSGTTRVYNKNLLKILPEKMERVINGVASTYGASAKFTHEWAIENPSVNDIEVVREIQNMIDTKMNSYKRIEFEALPIGEDFANMLSLVPGALALVGAANTSKGINYPHHHPKFQIDENALTVGTELYIAVAQDFLK